MDLFFFSLRLGWHSSSWCMLCFSTAATLALRLLNCLSTAEPFLDLYLTTWECFLVEMCHMFLISVRFRCKSASLADPRCCWSLRQRWIAEQTPERIFHAWQCVIKVLLLHGRSLSQDSRFSTVLMFPCCGVCFFSSGPLWCGSRRNSGTLPMHWFSSYWWENDSTENFC